MKERLKKTAMLSTELVTDKTGGYVFDSKAHIGFANDFG
jgi:hypothetical protein